jgi:hypothetical protein
MSCFFIFFAFTLSIFLGLVQYFAVESSWGVKIDSKLLKESESKLLIDLEH